ncbi:hypothetical protein [Chelativorans sp. AA-79]|uniref:hypothetical protein n=1 Tax=Chelativorans sp. AA-79 TaxID=3028735 RepID=UPI0023F80967|nr:hypothetical protein [Chelativorans sp. AA-79]WEX08315.1 hypothetical protein PVE73_19880 [Chelativorans sp. AA-79]
MHFVSKAIVPAIAVFCATTFAAAPAFSQATSATAPAQSGQANANASGDQYDTLFESLAGLLVQGQGSPNYSPNIGDTLPDNVQLQPMPQAAAQALPEAQNHHVAKVDDNTTVIADPESRQILGVISSVFGGGGSGNGATPNAAPGGTSNN